MPWEMYEVWSVDEEDREDLIDTTKSLKEARELAKQSLTDTVVEAIIYREVDGELEEFERIVR